MAASNNQDADKAKDLLIFVRQSNFVALCDRLKDILIHVVIPSKHFQREDLDFSTVQPMVKGTKEALREIIVHPGPAEQEFFSSIDGNKFKEDKIFDLNTKNPAFNNMKSRYFGALIDDGSLFWSQKCIVAKQYSENFLNMVQRNLKTY